MFTQVLSVALFAFSLVARAQDLPSCALTCLSSTSGSSCSQSDIPCLCRDNAFISSTAQCILTACPADQVAAATQAAQGLCGAAGVSVSIPSVAPSSSGSSSVSGSVTPTAPTASVSVTGTPSTTSSGAAPAQTSNGAVSQSVNAVAGMVAFGLAALAL
ncbi:hypothetical protein CCMSSC00406_0003369 [Pleurotus cornucopiae]|uniref:Uncharacterized protein n=1 Tax=Pleurotus cornucopiae TaxID=5321 RepID=A0ACB7J8Q9_PLECO|nr:hypothetical protein CCMSSC00406_0003369 [Pleurotus cornucopiae]